MPNKPCQYGFLLKEFNEVAFPFAHRVEPFFGKPQEEPTEYYQPTVLAVTLRLVDKVCQHQDLRGVHITYDNLYTSIPLAKKLLERGIQSTGTYIFIISVVTHLLFPVRRYPSVVSRP